MDRQTQLILVMCRFRWNKASEYHPITDQCISDTDNRKKDERARLRSSFRVFRENQVRQKDQRIRDVDGKEAQTISVEDVQKARRKTPLTLRCSLITSQANDRRF